MALAKEKPLTATDPSHESDFAAWADKQALLLKSGKFSLLDLDNLVDEVESMGREQQHALMSSYRLVMSHLLKWQYQPAKRSKSWTETIGRERSNIEDREEMNRSLARKVPDMIKAAYAKAVREAARESGLDPATFPATCPFTVEQLRDHDFLPA